MELTRTQAFETADSKEDELLDAQAMADWFPDYLYGVTNEPLSLPETAIIRLEEQFGKGKPSDQISIIRDYIVGLEPTHQANVALYFCGYPDDALSVLADEDSSVEESLALLEQVLAPLLASNNNVIPIAEARHAHDSRQQTNALAFTTEIDDSRQEKLADVRFSNDPVKDYLQQIGKVKLLNAAQEVEIATAIEVGLFAQERLDNELYQSSEEKSDLEYLSRLGNRNKEHFINANLRLVVSIAKRYAGRGMPFLDLIQEGNKGLLHAVEMFDFTKGYKFSTYGTNWIRQSIQRALADQGREIRMPVHATEKLNKIIRAQATLMQLIGKEPTLEEVAEEVNMEVDKVRELMDIAYQTSPVSLNTPLGSDGDAELADIVHDPSRKSFTLDVENQVQQKERRTLIEEMMVSLSEREKVVVFMRFGFDNGKIATLDEIGEALEVTRERARQIQGKAMDKLRSHPRFFEFAMRNQDLTRD